MAYIRIKTVYGRKYKYVVTGKRLAGNGVRQKVLKYLGPVDPVYKKIGSGEKRKTNASVYARKLSEDETAELKRAEKSSDAFTRDRAKIILLSSLGLAPTEIAEKTGCEKRKARTAIKEFNAKGLPALQRGKAKGGERKFDETVKKLILFHFSKRPREDFGLHFTTWSVSRLRDHLIERGVVKSISAESLRQILLSAKVRLERSKRWQYSPDPEFDKKNSR